MPTADLQTGSATGETAGVVGSIDAVRVFTFDLARARRFYARGMGLSERMAGPTYAVFATPGADLILEQVDADETGEADGLVGRVAGFSFTVEDCAATCALLHQRGVHVVGKPERQVWGGVLAFVEDPDGNILTLVQH